jgi:hypothetical protein
MVPGAAMAGDELQDSLLEISQALGRAGTVQAQFTQSRQLKAMTRPVISSGRLLMAPGRGVIWKVESPYRITLVVTKDKRMEIFPDGRKKIYDKSGRSTHMNTILYGLLAGKFDALNQYFSVQSDFSNGKWSMLLTPLEPASAYVDRVTLNGSNYVERVRIDEINGDTVTIYFFDHAGNVQLGDGEIRFFESGG